MAEMSEQTEAIIERLKAEGQLVRNTGTNSIKTVKADLTKFEGVFSTISANVAEQTSIMRQTLEFDREEAKRAADQARSEQLAEVARQAEDEEKSKTKNEDEKKKTKKFKDEKSTGGVLTNVLKGFKDFVVKSLLGAVGGVALFELARGFFDERTDGGFSKFFDEIDWNGMFTNFSSISSSVANGIEKFTNFLNDPLGTLLAGSVTGGATVALGAAGLKSLLGSDENDDNKTTKARSKLKNFVRLSSLGLITTGVTLAGNSVKDWIGKQEWSDDEIAGINLGDAASGAVGLVQTGATALTLATMFGLGPLSIPAALAAVAITGLVKLRNYLREKADELTEKQIAEYNSKLDTALDEEGMEQVDAALEAYQARTELMRRKMFQTGDEFAAAIEEAQKRDQELLDVLTEAREEEIKTLGQGESAVSPIQTRLAAENEFEQQGRSRLGTLITFLTNSLQGDLNPEQIRQMREEGLLTGIMEQDLASLPSNIRGDYPTQQAAIEAVLQKLAPGMTYAPEDALSLPGMPTLDQFTGQWFKSAKREKREYEQALESYNQFMANEILPPMVNNLKTLEETGSVPPLVLFNQGDNIRYGDHITGGTSLAVQSQVGVASPIAQGSEFPGHAN